MGLKTEKIMGLNGKTYTIITDRGMHLINRYKAGETEFTEEELNDTIYIDDNGMVMSMPFKRYLANIEGVRPASATLNVD